MRSRTLGVISLSGISIVGVLVGAITLTTVSGRSALAEPVNFCVVFDGFRIVNSCDFKVAVAYCYQDCTRMGEEGTRLGVQYYGYNLVIIDQNGSIDLPQLSALAYRLGIPMVACRASPGMELPPKDPFATEYSLDRARINADWLRRTCSASPYSP